MNDSSYFPVDESDLSYESNIMSGVISTQCNDSMNNVESISSTADSPSSLSSTRPSTSSTQPSTSTTQRSTSSTLPITFTEVPYNESANENCSQSHLMTFESMNNSNYSPIAKSEINYEVDMSEDINLQCNEPINNTTTMSVEKNAIEERSPKQTNSSPYSKCPSAKVALPKSQANILKEEIERLSEIYKQSIESEPQSRIHHEVFLLSKRFDIPIDTLKKMVIDDPLHIFQSELSASITSSMITVSPIIETKTKNEITGSLDVQYKVENIAKSEPFAKTNLIDLMAELSKTLPSWSLCIVADPPRYVISHMSMNKYDIPILSKSIVLDKHFNAYVYINRCLEHSYCKRCVNAADIINLILEINSL